MAWWAFREPDPARRVSVEAVVVLLRAATTFPSPSVGLRQLGVLHAGCRRFACIYIYIEHTFLPSYLNLKLDLQFPGDEVRVAGPLDA